MRRDDHVSGAWMALRAVVGLVYLFMLGPILITATVSFNATNRSLFPPQGFSLRWWERALSSEWLDPLLFSLKLAAVAGLLATPLALPLAYALARHRFHGRGALVALTMGPLLLPALVTGVGMLQLSSMLGWRDYIGLPALIVGHVVICLPFSVRDHGHQPAGAAAEPRERRGEPWRAALAHAGARRPAADQERHRRRRGVRLHPLVHRREPVAVPGATGRDRRSTSRSSASSSSALRRRSRQCRC